MMNARRLTWTLVLIASSVVHGPAPFKVVRAAEPSQPNIVFLLADDLGWQDLSCYGSSFCETPNIDSLADAGMRFTQAYTAASICSPTRASLMTGKHPVRTGITDYIPGLKSKPHQLRTPRTDLQLKHSEVTMGEMFSECGYETFYGGKWHLGGEGFEPDSQGFDHYVGDKQLGKHNRDWQVGLRITHAFDSFIANRSEADPFFAYLSFHEPHLPILEYPDHIAHFTEKAKKLGSEPPPRAEHSGLTRARQDNAAYGSEVAGLDDFVGNVLQTLQQKGLRENTIIVFFSDNGGLSTKSKPGPTNNDPLRAGKGWLYEGGIRVPLIVSMPGKIQPGSVSEQVTVSFDLVPTLLELAGQKLRPQDHVDGRSIAGVLTGEQAVLPERAEYWHYPHYHGSTWSPGAAVRHGDWKLIQFDDGQTTELYNLQTDESERVDLSLQEPARVALLRENLANWQEDVGAQFATPANLATDELVAWCIVPFDAAKRGPKQRAEMLQELGLKRLAYDWREEHVPTWDKELDQLDKHGIELTSFWCSSSLKPLEDKNTKRIVEFLRRRQVATQLWVMLPDGELMKTRDEQARLDKAAAAVRELAEHVAGIDCSVGLYNHGGWVGRPTTLVKIMQRLSDLDNVGIVYNFHHSHEDLDNFPNSLLSMKPYLMCLNLNGTTVGGPKIQSLGQGDLDRDILRWIRQVQYSGPIGILDHRDELDAKKSLQQNLVGLKQMLGPVQ